MPRTAALNPRTRERLLDAATRLMLERGYAATSVDAICAAAGVTKGSFFHYFDSKDALARSALERFCTLQSRRFEDILAGEEDPVKRVRRYLDGVVAMAKDPEAARGCLLGTFAQEVCGCSEGIRAACCCGFEEWAEGFARDLARAKAAAAPKAKWKPKEVAEHFVALLEGSLILAKAKRDGGVVARQVGVFREYLEGLLRS
jgi:TetR/AcrR family transcriptional repressor of nem operon